MEKMIHEGRNVRKLRDILGIKQDGLANNLGISQQRMSEIEQREKIDDDLKMQIAGALGIPVEAISNFDEREAMNNITTLHDNSRADFNYQCTINPIEKWLEALKKNEELYEKLLQSEKEKNVLYKELLKTKG